MMSDASFKNRQRKDRLMDQELNMSGEYSQYTTDPRTTLMIMYLIFVIHVNQVNHEAAVHHE